MVVSRHGVATGSDRGPSTPWKLKHCWNRAARAACAPPQEPKKAMAQALPPPIFRQIVAPLTDAPGSPIRLSPGAQNNHRQRPAASHAAGASASYNRCHYFGPETRAHALRSQHRNSNNVSGEPISAPGNVFLPSSFPSPALIRRHQLTQDHTPKLRSLSHSHTPRLETASLGGEGCMPHAFDQSVIEHKNLTSGWAV
ncbi:uncharacterized protein PV07_03518 [Cladophialophora immunda]|uniref:Uncharacterized protein n=1 Tax=Cladophialophora immunda TaxID=569365 RepID=A0A0D2B2P6_9EURO|nr:uncharacterized protein PV07_03518 [Cladophialophora immunda]KIW31932.1 hypothetical protein PV07_03518 [Cladophialophora immunda]